MMMDIDSGNYFDIDSVGGRIWALLESPSAFDQLCETLCAEYDVEATACRDETADFIGELADKGLVVLQ